MGVYLRAEFEASSIILTSFRQGGNFTKEVIFPDILWKQHVWEDFCPWVMNQKALLVFQV